MDRRGVEPLYQACKARVIADIRTAHNIVLRDRVELPPQPCRDRVLTVIRTEDKTERARFELAVSVHHGYDWFQVSWVKPAPPPLQNIPSSFTTLLLRLTQISTIWDLNPFLLLGGQTCNRWHLWCILYGVSWTRTSSTFIGYTWFPIKPTTIITLLQNNGRLLILDGSLAVLLKNNSLVKAIEGSRTLSPTLARSYATATSLLHKN